MIKNAMEYLQNYGTELERQFLCEQYEEINEEWVVTTRKMSDEDIIFAYMQYINI